jgi:hypothetical protein
VDRRLDHGNFAPKSYFSSSTQPCTNRQHVSSSPQFHSLALDFGMEHYYTLMTSPDVYKVRVCTSLCYPSITISFSLSLTNNFFSQPNQTLSNSISNFLSTCVESSPSLLVSSRFSPNSTLRNQLINTSTNSRPHGSCSSCACATGFSDQRIRLRLQLPMPVWPLPERYLHGSPKTRICNQRI